jgi:PiT family inorganic phosphate transporter
MGVPVSTTHVITGAVAGVGAVKGAHAVKWQVTINIVWAWVLTIPAAALCAALVYKLARLF